FSVDLLEIIAMDVPKRKLLTRSLSLLNSTPSSIDNEYQYLQQNFRPPPVSPDRLQTAPRRKGAPQTRGALLAVRTSFVAPSRSSAGGPRPSLFTGQLLIRGREFSPCFAHRFRPPAAASP